MASFTFNMAIAIAKREELSADRTTAPPTIDLLQKAIFSCRAEAFAMGVNLSPGD
jgi:hypothetical protein